ncbi:MAG: hypothetical protein SWK76_08775 [Actinomycetota bacterium]|nr:hypothetical protein [Actinomycetota bacterium]
MVEDILEDVLDSVKTTRHQLGTLSHMGDDIDHTLSRFEYLVTKVEDFFSERYVSIAIAALLIAVVSAANHLRAWFKARSIAT